MTLLGHQAQNVDDSRQPAGFHWRISLDRSAGGRWCIGGSSSRIRKRNGWSERKTNGGGSADLRKATSKPTPDAALADKGQVPELKVEAAANVTCFDHEIRQLFSARVLT